MPATELFLKVASGLCAMCKLPSRSCQRWTPVSGSEQGRKNIEEGTGEEQGRMDEGQEQMSSDTGTSAHAV